MKWIFLIIGALAGVFLVRALLLNDIEVFAWELFWHDFFAGKLSGSKEEMNTILSSKTFLKCSLGFFAGGVVGYMLARFVRK